MLFFPLGLGEEGGQRWQREGWLGGGIGIYSREYGRLFWKNPLGRKLHVMSAPRYGFVTSLMLLERLGEGGPQQIPGYSRLPFRDMGASYRPERCASWLDSPNPRGRLGPVDIFISKWQGAYRGRGREKKAGRRNGLDQTRRRKKGPGIFSLFSPQPSDLGFLQLLSQLVSVIAAVRCREASA